MGLWRLEAINTNKAPLQPCLDPVSNATTTGGGVHVVVVDGQLIVGTGKDIDDGRGNS